jgi:hypothetical protein
VARISTGPGPTAISNYVLQKLKAMAKAVGLLD